MFGSRALVSSLRCFLHHLHSSRSRYGICFPKPGVCGVSVPPESRKPFVERIRLDGTDQIPPDSGRSSSHGVRDQSKMLLRLNCFCWLGCAYLLATRETPRAINRYDHGRLRLPEPQSVKCLTYYATPFFETDPPIASPHLPKAVRLSQIAKYPRASNSRMPGSSLRFRLDASYPSEKPRCWQASRVIEIHTDPVSRIAYRESDRALGDRILSDFEEFEIMLSGARLKLRKITRSIQGGNRRAPFPPVRVRWRFATMAQPHVVPHMEILHPQHSRARFHQAF